MSTAKYGLTTREMEVLGEAAVGHQDKEIGERLGISPLTVRVHLTSIRTKMGCRNRTQLAIRALNEGLIPAGNGVSC